MNDSEHNTQWKQALEICESMVDLSTDQKYQHVISLGLDEGVKSKVFKIIDRLNEKNTVLDESNCSYFIKDIEQEKDFVGQCIDNYQLIKRIAKGGMSNIYEALLIESEIQNHVAIKILSPYMFSEKSLELFKREQLILSKLKHPSIVSFHHSGHTKDGTQYLVMEFIENALNIEEYCIQNNLTANAIVELIINVADVLAYSHNNLVIHRDIKADNILIDEQGRVKVIDFGIGQYDVDSSSEVTQVFTFETASPEQILGKSVTVQTDIFSLGALLLQLLVKQKPLPKTNISQYNIQDVAAHTNKLLQQSDLDKDLKNIVHQAMHIDVNQRYVSMAMFTQDLRNWKNHKPVIATADTFFYRFSKLCQRNKMTTLLVILVLITAVLSTVFIYQSESAKQVAVSKKIQSLEIIRSVFHQANPLNKQFDESTLTAALDNIKVEQKDLLEADPELKFLIYSEMAKLYRSNNFYQKAQENTEEALQTLALFTAKNDQVYINTQADLINILVENGQYQTAIDKSILLMSQLNNDNVSHYRALVVVNLSIATSYYILNDIDLAKKYLEQTYLYIKKSEHQNEIDVILRADAYNLTALIYKKEGDYELASQSYLEAIDLLRKSNQGKKDLVVNLTNFGVLKADLNEYKEAEKYYLEAKSIIEKVDENHTQIAVVNIQYSILLRLMKRYDEAEQLLLKSLPILKKANEKRQLIWIYKGLCKFSLHNNKIADALKYFNKGYQLSKKLYGFDHPQTLGLLNKLIAMALVVPDLIENEELFKAIDDGMTSNVFSTLEFEDYQIHKAIYEKKIIINDYPLSYITEYMYGFGYQNDDERKKWLSNKLNNQDTNLLLKNFAALWMQAFSKDEKAYIQICEQTSEWGFTHHYELKTMFLQLCMDTAKQHNFEQLKSVVQQAESIKININKNRKLIEQYIANLLL